MGRETEDLVRADRVRDASMSSGIRGRPLVAISICLALSVLARRQPYRVTSTSSARSWNRMVPALARVSM